MEKNHNFKDSNDYSNDSNDINFLYKFYNSWHSITLKINKDLQENNFLIKKYIYLIEIEQGVVWGYDERFYEINQSSTISRKKVTEEEDLFKKDIN